MKLKWLRYYVVALMIVLSICMNSKLYIPKTLIFIEDYAFHNAQLNDDLVIYYEGDDFDWMLVEKPEILESVDVVFECDYYNREDKNQ